MENQQFIIAFAPSYDAACTERFVITVGYNAKVIELTLNPSKATHYGYDEAQRLVNALNDTGKYIALAQPVSSEVAA